MSDGDWKSRGSRSPRDLTLTRLEGLVANMIGKDAINDGIFLTDRKVWVSGLNMIRASCPVCGQEFVGPDYNVFHLLATHEYGHNAMLKIAQLNAEMEEYDDEEKGGTIA